MIPTFANWPKTYDALIRTYFDQATFGAPGQIPAAAPYMLAGLLRYKQAWESLHGHHPVDQATLDAAAAHEIYYQKNRGSKPLKPHAWLCACIQKLVTERPERILDRELKRLAKVAGKTR